MTLRSILLGLVWLFALMVLATAGLLGHAATKDLTGLRVEIAMQEQRNGVFALIAAMGLEDIARIEATQSPAFAADLATAQARTDAALAAAQAHPDQPGSDTARANPPSLRLYDAVAAHISRQRHSPDGAPASRVFEDSLIGVIDEPASHDETQHALLVLRGMLLRDVLALVQNRSRIEARLAGHAGAPLRDTSSAARAFAEQRRGATAARIAQSAAAADHSGALPDPVLAPLRLATVRVGQVYRPAENRLLAALIAQGVDATTLAQWRDASRLTVAGLLQADALLAGEASRRLTEAYATSRARMIALGLALLLAAALVVAVHCILSRRVLAPLGEIRARLAQLAAEDFTQPAPSGTALCDITDMHKALDQLSIDGRRRLAMQAELARLSDRVVAANRQMTAELEAAARVQHAQLPASPCAFQGGTFHAFFRPSRVVAGDTYDCLPLPDGRSRIFQIDVSGHGAPAALVSIASHIALKQAMLSAPPAEALSDIIARINRDWAEDLPYFTLLAVEIDPATATASIVQCGHPALLRLPATGGVKALGEGGLPIGVLPDATFSTHTCPFLPGDRLVLVTDGVTETTDPDAQMFGDDRLRALLAPPPDTSTRPAPVQRLFDRIERALWDWRGSESLEDDITILVLEAT